MAGALAAALTGAPAAPAPVPQVRCTVDEPRLGELSGLVVRDGAAWAMSDGGRRVELLQLDLDDCSVTRTRTADVNPYDAEDLALAPDGAFWVADIGDNDRDRTTVAVIVLPARGEARLHRLTYPDGAHDAEALLVDASGRPAVITKETGRPAGVYRTAEPPDGAGPTPLVRIGELALPASNTEGGPVGGIGSRMVTGAAMSADGSVVAVRTYTDAWLFPVRDGDLVAALQRTPVQVPLPDEPQGEAIAFGPDGTLLSGSERRGGERGQIRAVAAAVALAAGGSPTGQTTPAPGAPTADAPAGDAPAPEWLPAAIGGGVAVGLLLLVTVLLGLRGALRRR